MTKTRVANQIATKNIFPWDEEARRSDDGTDSEDGATATKALVEGSEDGEVVNDDNDE